MVKVDVITAKTVPALVALANEKAIAGYRPAGCMGQIGNRYNMIVVKDLNPAQVQVMEPATTAQKDAPKKPVAKKGK